MDRPRLCKQRACLLLWDAIFAPLPAAFGSASQDAPDDLLSGGRGAFAARRAPLLDSLIEDIEMAPSDDEGATGSGGVSLGKLPFSRFSTLTALKIRASHLAERVKKPPLAVSVWNSIQLLRKKCWS